MPLFSILPQGNLPVFKVSVTVPATSINLGPGLNALGLALSLHATVEMIVRDDDQLHITVEGEGADQLTTTVDNPILRTAMRVFQHFENAPAGLQINIKNQIPLDAGLGGRTALTIASLVAASNLINGGLNRSDIVKWATTNGSNYESVIAAMFGGLSICSTDKNDQNIHISMDIVPLRVVVAVPRLQDYVGDKSPLPDLVSLNDAIYNIGQTAFLIEALRTGDLALLTQSMGDRLHQNNYFAHIPAYEAVSLAAYDEGAIGVVLSGSGPAIIAVADQYHDAIATAMKDAFADAEVEADTWILGVDRQGMLISVVE
jgi:homoserine kinase